VARVRLQAPKAQGLVQSTAASQKDRRYRTCFDWISKRRARAMRLYDRHLVGIQARIHQ
jgi:hypothetical protein